jgi:hypothetical protein
MPDRSAGRKCAMASHDNDEMRKAMAENPHELRYMAGQILPRVQRFQSR